MTKKKTGTNGFEELVRAVEAVRRLQREHGLSSEQLERLVRDAEDGEALGLEAVPPLVPSKVSLSVTERVDLMQALACVARVLHARVRAAEGRTARMAA